MKRGCAGAVLAISLWLLGSDNAPAQGRSPVTTASVTGLACTFRVLATGTWIDGTVRAEVKDARLALEFDEIDTDEGTGIARGGSGAPHMTVRLASGNLHFIQMSSQGPLYVTTVFDQRTPEGRLKAVHTRHEYTLVSLPGFTSRPEQYYGDCDVRAAKQ